MDKVFLVKEIVALTGDKLKGDENIKVCGVASLDEATEDQISFLGNRKYEKMLAETKAKVIIVPADYEEEPQNGQTFLYSQNPDLSFSKAISMFAPEAIKYAPGFHPSCSIDPTAVIGENVHIGPCAVVDAFAVIGDNTVIAAGSYIGQETRIGQECLIYQNVTIRERCTLGNHCIIHSGSVIGADGFGFAPTRQGIVKIPQVGGVEIHDDVEIGANTCIDRARFGKTVIKSGVKVDNLVQIAHNVEVGECSLLVGQCGIAGSAKIGRGCIIAGRAGINGHITIGDGSKVAGTSSVVKTLAPGSVACGTPAEPQRDFMERWTLPKKVKKLQAKLKALEAQLKDLS